MIMHIKIKIRYDWGLGEKTQFPNESGDKSNVWIPKENKDGKWRD